MKCSALLNFGLALTTSLLLASTPSLAGDCMEVALQFKHDLEETVDRMKNSPRRDAGSGFTENSHTFSVKHEIYALTSLIDLYSNANKDKCEGHVKEIHDALVEKSQKKRIKKSLRREFEAPTCETLMARIDRGRTGEFCPNGKIGKYDVEKIKKTIEVENRKRKIALLFSARTP